MGRLLGSLQTAQVATGSVVNKPQSGHQLYNTPYVVGIANKLSEAFAFNFAVSIPSNAMICTPTLCYLCSI